MLAGVVISDQQELADLYQTKFTTMLFGLKVPSRTGEAVNALNFLKFYRKLLQIFRQTEASHVLVPMHHPWMVAALALLPRRMKLVSVIHDAIPHEGDPKMLVALTNFVICKYSAATLFMSESQRQHQLSQAFCGKIKTGMIRHPSFSHYFDHTSDHSATKPNSVDFIFFGRLEPYKGLNFLIEAFELVRQKRSNASLLVVGRPGKGFIREDIERPGVQIDERYIPDREVPATIQGGKVVVLPYLTATQSGVMTAANDFGRICVSTPLSGLKEQAEYTGRVYFSDQLTPEAFARAMIEALDGGAIGGALVKSKITDYFEADN